MPDTDDSINEGEAEEAFYDANAELLDAEGIDILDVYLDDQCD